jgi:uncharacterized membrane protein YhaH (DUF805 family)
MRGKFFWLLVGCWASLFIFVLSVVLFHERTPFFIPVITHMRGILSVLIFTTFIYGLVRFYKAGMRHARRKTD